MKRFGASICAVLCFAALHSSCVAQANPWNGSWKIDPATVKYEGPTFSIATDADGYTVTRDGTAMPKVVCDGQPKPADDLMTTCTKSGESYMVDSTKDGKPVTKAVVSFSADGKTMTRKMEFMPPGEAPYTITAIANRVSGGPGPDGMWKTAKVEESADNGILSIAVSGDSVAFKETDRPEPITCKLDGTETTLAGGGTMSVKLVDPHTLKVTYRQGGKVRRENTFVLTGNGSAIEETDVTPEPSPSTTSMTFHKS